MNQHRTTQSPPVRKPRKEDGNLERLAREIDPPGRESSDEELKDPGKAIPSSPVVDNRS